jgi:hypothetical protein
MPFSRSAKHRANDILPQVMESNKEEEPNQHKWEKPDPAFNDSPLAPAHDFPGNNDEGDSADYGDHLIR